MSWGYRNIADILHIAAFYINSTYSWQVTSVRGKWPSLFCRSMWKDSKSIIEELIYMLTPLPPYTPYPSQFVLLYFPISPQDCQWSIELLCHSTANPCLIQIIFITLYSINSVILQLSIIFPSFSYAPFSSFRTSFINMTFCHSDFSFNFYNILTLSFIFYSDILPLRFSFE